MPSQESKGSDPTRYAPPGAIWVCGACGKTSQYDCYGIEGEHSRGWDESCMLNAFLADASSVVRNAGGRAIDARPFDPVTSSPSPSSEDQPNGDEQ